MVCIIIPCGLQTFSAICKPIAKGFDLGRGRGSYQNHGRRTNYIEPSFHIPWYLIFVEIEMLEILTPPLHLLPSNEHVRLYYCGYFVILPDMGVTSGLGLLPLGPC